MKPEWWETDEDVEGGPEAAVEVVGRSFAHLGYARHGDDNCPIDRSGNKVPADLIRSTSYREGVDVNRRQSPIKGADRFVFQYLSPLKCVETIRVETPEEFLAFLDIANPRWGDSPEVSWIFRGQTDSDWFLQPSAWRKQGRFILRPLIDQFESSDFWGAEDVEKELANDGQKGRRIGGSVYRAAEYEAIHRFGEMADRLGLPVPRKTVDLPNGDQFLRNIELNIVDDHFGLEETVACLAQHHGVPTALLDWTTDPWTAAFFAADEADRQCEEWNEGLANLGPDAPGDGPLAGDMSVWALDVSRMPEVSVPLTGEREGILEIVRCPRSDHNFLHAQDGLFLMHRQSGNHFMKHGVWPVFEDVLEGASGDGPPILRKLILSKAQASLVLRGLWRRNYYRARLMPTYDNVASSALRRLRLEE